MTHTHTDIEVRQNIPTHTQSNLITAIMHTRVPILLIPQINHVEKTFGFFFHSNPPRCTTYIITYNAILYGIEHIRNETQIR
jgi:hypothetical protein